MIVSPLHIVKNCMSVITYAIRLQRKILKTLKSDSGGIEPIYIYILGPISQPQKTKSDSGGIEPIHTGNYTHTQKTKIRFRRNRTYTSTPCSYPHFIYRSHHTHHLYWYSQKSPWTCSDLLQFCDFCDFLRFFATLCDFLRFFTIFSSNILCFYTMAPEFLAGLSEIRAVILGSGVNTPHLQWEFSH